MDNFKNIQEAIINAVNTIVEKKFKSIKRNYYVDGVIQTKNNDDTYDVIISNEKYQNIPSQYKLNYKVGDVVQILIKNGDWNKKFIDDISYHNKPLILDNVIDNILDSIYPVGSIYMSVNDVSPASFLGGTWERWGNGRVPVGVDTSNDNFKTVEKTGGESTVTLTADQMPSHTHGTGNNNVFTTNANVNTETIARRQVVASSDSGIYAMTANSKASDYTSSGGIESIGGIYTTSATGGDKSHNNLQPYITCYMWKRTE